MKEPLLLAIDNGTQSVRALVFDIQGTLKAKSYIPIEPYFSSKPGWTEQHPKIFWQAVCSACQGLWTQGITPQDIGGIAVTTQRATMLCLDRQGKPLRPAVVWLDQRKATVFPDLGLLWKTIFALLGLSRTVNYFQTKALDNWLFEHEPETWKTTSKYLLLSGYLNFMLTGEYKDSVANQVGYLPFDYKKLQWAKGMDWKWKALRVTPDKLPDLVPPGYLLGEIRTNAAKETGLKPGTPVFAAAADKACEVLGSGAIYPWLAGIGYGTTATINITSPKYREPFPFIPPYPAAIPGQYSLEIQNFRGFWLVSWFKKEFGQLETQLAKQTGQSAEELLNRMLDETEPGAMGLMSLPYWTPGVKIPGPEAKGALIGFGDVHSRAHIYRSILEGLAFALREGKERLEKRTKIKIKKLMVAGGGSQSNAVMQITADIFGLPAVRPHTYETSGLGAAIDVACGLKLHPDFPTAIQAMTRPGQEFEPDPKRHTFYTALYQQVYQKMYARLRPLYQAIKEITGYPE